MTQVLILLKNNLKRKILTLVIETPLKNDVLFCFIYTFTELKNALLLCFKKKKNISLKCFKE